MSSRCIKEIELSQLLGLDTSDEFFDHIWERRTHTGKATIKGLVRSILTQSQYENVVFDVLKNGGNGLSIVENFRAYPVNMDRDPSSALTSVFEAYRRGCTLLLSNIHARWGPITAICRKLENIFIEQGIPLADEIGANCYLTPSNCQGFDIHYDNHCILVIQLQGKKNWKVYSPLEKLPIGRCLQSIPLDSLSPACIETTMDAGDVMYIPRGFPHSALCTDVSSLHISLCFRTLKWLDIFSELFAKQAVFRKSLRLGFCNHLSNQDYLEKTLLAEVQDFQIGDIVQRKIFESLANLRPTSGDRLQAIDAISRLDGDSQFCRATNISCFTYTQDEQVSLYFTGGKVTLPIAMKPVFDFIATNMIFTVSQLPIIEADFDAQELIKSLIARGLLIPAKIMS